MKHVLFIAFFALAQMAYADDPSVLSGTAMPSLCSGAIIKLGWAPGRIYVLTNAHCWSGLLNEALRLAPKIQILSKKT